MMFKEVVTVVGVVISISTSQLASQYCTSGVDMDLTVS